MDLSSTDHICISELIMIICSLIGSVCSASPFSFYPSVSFERSLAASWRPCLRSRRHFVSLYASSYAIYKMQYIIIQTYSLKLCIYSHTYRILMWKLESLKENARERKQRKKVEEKKKWRKFKHKFEVNKLFLYTTLNLFTYLILLYKKLNNFKIYKFLNNFNYIWLPFIFFIVKPKTRKSISFIFFFFP